MPALAAVARPTASAAPSESVLVILCCANFEIDFPNTTRKSAAPYHCKRENPSRRCPSQRHGIGAERGLNDQVMRRSGSVCFAAAESPGCHARLEPRIHADAPTRQECRERRRCSGGDLRIAASTVKNQGAQSR